MTHQVKPALCLDLDGTVRKSKSGDFIQSPDDIELIPGIKELIWKFKEIGFLVAAFSNQGGVAFGHKTPDQIEAELRATEDLLDSEDTKCFDSIKAIYLMEGGTVFPYNYRSLRRKPNIGMLSDFEADAWNAGFVVDWNNSLFVGDRAEDEQCASNAEIEFLHIDDFLRLGDKLIEGLIAEYAKGGSIQ